MLGARQCARKQAGQHNQAVPARRTSSLLELFATPAVGDVQTAPAPAATATALAAPAVGRGAGCTGSGDLPGNARQTVVHWVLFVARQPVLVIPFRPGAHSVQQTMVKPIP